MPAEDPRELLAAGTPIPWRVDSAGQFILDSSGTCRGAMHRDADAALIVWAVNNLGELLNERDRLLRLLERALPELDRYEGCDYELGADITKSLSSNSDRGRDGKVGDG